MIFILSVVFNSDLSSSILITFPALATLIVDVNEIKELLKRPGQGAPKTVQTLETADHLKETEGKMEELRPQIARFLNEETVDGKALGYMI